jgi:hypothetical protein
MGGRHFSAVTAGGWWHLAMQAPGPDISLKRERRSLPPFAGALGRCQEEDPECPLLNKC